MEDQKRFIRHEAGKTDAAAGLPERNGNEGSGKDGKKSSKGRPDAHERKVASEDMRHMNAEQDEEQLRKDEEARRNHKSQ